MTSTPESNADHRLARNSINQSVPLLRLLRMSIHQLAHRKIGRDLYLLAKRIVAFGRYFLGKGHWLLH